LTPRKNPLKSRRNWFEKELKITINSFNSPTCLTRFINMVYTFLHYRFHKPFVFD
jgi:hypothetical protein